MNNNLKAGATQNVLRYKLDGVPPVHFYQGGGRCPEDFPFPSCMRSCMEFLDENPGCKFCQTGETGWRLRCAYAYFMGITGAAFFLTWKEGWHADNQVLGNAEDDPPDVFRRAFRACGYFFEFLEKREGENHEPLFREKIRASLVEKHHPVIGFGVVGPPEACLITGFDDNLDTLIGWSYFQNFPEFNQNQEFEPDGSFRKKNWYDDTRALIVIGEKQNKPDLIEMFRLSLENLVEMHKKTVVRGRACGQAAFTAWSEQMLNEEDFFHIDESLLMQRFNIHNDAVSQLAEGRWYGAQFLMDMADHVGPDVVEDLLRAAACFAAIHARMWKIWEFTGGNGNPEGYKFLPDKRIRRQIAFLILESGAKEAEGVKYVESALRKLIKV